MYHNKNYFNMKDIEKAYDKGVEDGRKQMLDEFMNAFYKKVSDDTKKQVDEYVERQTEYTSGGDYKPKIVGFNVLFNE